MGGAFSLGGRPKSLGGERVQKFIHSFPLISLKSQKKFSPAAGQNVWGRNGRMGGSIFSPPPPQAPRKKITLQTPPHGLSATVLKSDRRQGCLPPPHPRGGFLGGGVAPVLKLDRRQGSVTNAKTSVRGGGEFAVRCLYGVLFYNTNLSLSK